jgi:hypothetical protein
MGIVGSIIGPYAAAQVLRAPHGTGTLVLGRVTLGHTHRWLASSNAKEIINRAIICNAPRITLDTLESEIKVAPPRPWLPDDFHVEASLPEKLDECTDKQPLPRLKAQLSAVGADVIPVGQIEAQIHENLPFKWVVRPKTSGKLIMIVSLLVDVPNEELERGHLGLGNDSTKDLDFVRSFGGWQDTSFVQVDVLSPLGLTPFEDALFRAIGALVGMIGTLLAYPIWKRFFGQRREIGSPPEPPLIIKP